MGLLKELLEMSHEDLMELLDQKLKENIKDHEEAVKIGSLGVSPIYMSRYIEAVEKIRAYENKQR
ncbi:hypothetical protein DFQ00_102387 [Paenibacillus barcinonensis]|uniref:Uncharacterized protein n=2 Tax=Paenibacillus barcinonensis TaxID=198119 RepID=A0A2V4VDD5_PAEBA|nr:hypothetical protein DFQ00_102387 [Paenibacillus barcinonensis]